MNLLCIGLSHATTPVALRERFAGSSVVSPELLTPRPGLDEYAILSTCNRLELYAVMQPSDAEPLLALLEQISGLQREVFAAHLYQHENLEAVRHLARVAAGLDSLVVGESQILGQVAQAAETARRRGTAGRCLAAVFRSAVRAGKRARSETEIGRNPVSIGSVAVQLAQAALDDLCTARVLVIGAGEMAGLAIQALRERGVGPLTIVNRTPAAARELAQRWGGRVLGLAQLKQALAGADLVIAASGAPYILVTRSVLERAGIAGREAPLVFIDIAVPRNVSPDVAQLPHVRYFDIDDLQVAQDAGRAGRARAIPQVEGIVAEEVLSFQAWERRQSAVPLVSGLRARAEAIRQAEIERTLRRWPGAGEQERLRLEALTQAIVNRLLHHATTQLLNEAGEEQTARYAMLLQDLFVLEDIA